VSSYLSSLIAKQTNSPSQPYQDYAGYKVVSPDVNIGQLLTTDVTLPAPCQLAEGKFFLCSEIEVPLITTSLECSLITCAAVRGDSPGEITIPLNYIETQN
jgi:hypothetical protein